MTKPLPGSLTISRPLGARCFKIRLEDQSSGTQFLEVEIGLAELAEAMSGQGNRPCEFKLYKQAPVGMIQEHKEVKVACPRLGHRVTDEELQAILDPYEVDGWHGRLRDLTNHHRWVEGEEASMVTFTRFVEPPSND